MRIVASYLIGLIFGVGICISGMASPAKVLNFFDIAGSWDPSLAFVMGGALTVTFIGYRLVFGRAKPVLETGYHVPTKRMIDLPLVAGSVVFGVGWGLAGFCPGGALPALGTGQAEVVLFTASLVVGIFLARFLQPAISQRTDALAWPSSEK